MPKKKFVGCVGYAGKKGFAMQFNWLFVLIGGAVILGFFFSLILNQASQEEKKSSQETTQELDELFKASYAMGETEKVASLGRVDKKITFYCDEISEYLVEGASQSGRYDYSVIFSPAELDSKELLVQTLSFKAPFKIMPLVYASNKDVEYVFVDDAARDAAIMNLVFSVMPQNATKKSITPGEVSSYIDNNYDRTVFITTDETDLAGLSSFDSEADYERVFGVVINGFEGVVNYGEISFYSYDGTEFVLQGTSPFFDIKKDVRLALGAVISHDKTIYECNLKKMLKRFDLLTKLYDERLLYYADTAPDYCQSYYSTAKEYVDAAQLYAQSPVLSVENFKNLVLAMNDLDTLNSYLVSSEDCSRIY